MDWDHNIILLICPSKYKLIECNFFKKYIYEFIYIYELLRIPCFNRFRWLGMN